jgi:hypothetical protein
MAVRREWFGCVFLEYILGDSVCLCGLMGHLVVCRVNALDFLCGMAVCCRGGIGDKINCTLTVLEHALIKLLV